jgi:hypothetical protein
MMRPSYDLVAKWRSSTSCREPELLEMFLYNDFLAYGLLGLQESVVSTLVLGIDLLMALTYCVQLIQFDGEFQKHDTSFQVLWPIMAGMMH